MWETGARQVAEAQEQGQALEALDRLERHRVGPVREMHAAGCRRALRALVLQQVSGRGRQRWSTATRVQPCRVDAFT